MGQNSQSACLMDLIDGFLGCRPDPCDITGSAFTEQCVEGLLDRAEIAFLDQQEGDLEPADGLLPQRLERFFVDRVAQALQPDDQVPVALAPGAQLFCQKRCQTFFAAVQKVAQDMALLAVLFGGQLDAGQQLRYLPGHGFAS